MASDRMVSGAYKTEYGEGDDISKVMAKVEVSSIPIAFHNMHLSHGHTVNVMVPGVCGSRGS